MADKKDNEGQSTKKYGLTDDEITISDDGKHITIDSEALAERIKELKAKADKEDDDVKPTLFMRV